MDTRRINTEVSKDSKNFSKKISLGKIGESMGARHYEKYVNINLKIKQIKSRVYLMMKKRNKHYPIILNSSKEANQNIPIEQKIKTT